MKKNIFNELFGELFNDITTTDIDKFFNETKEVVKNLVADTEKKTVNEEKKDDDTVHSYFNESGERYENGELVEKYEKEYVNGECTKDETLCLDDKTDCECDKKAVETSCCKKNGQYVNRLKKEITSLKEKNADYENQINDMKAFIDNLMQENRQLQKNYDDTLKTLNKIKCCL